MTTAATLVEKTKGFVLRGHRTGLNKLASGVTAGATTLSFSFDLDRIQKGARLSIGLEHYYVWEVNESAKTATVQPGTEGTTQAAHFAGDLVLVEPVVSDFEALQAINDDLNDLSSPDNGMFRVRTVDLTYSAALTGYDLTGVTDIVDVIEVRHEAAGSFKDWPLVDNWSLARDMSTGEFASGTALLIHGDADFGSSVRVKYKAPYGRLAALADNVESVTGLQATAVDIPPLGAAAKLVAFSEAKRNFTSSQGQPRRADEVPPGAVARSATPDLSYREMRIRHEATRLAAMYPVRLRRASWA